MTLIDFPQRSIKISNLTDQYRRSKAFIDLITCLEACLEFGCLDCTDLVEVWEKNRVSLPQCDPTMLEAYAQLLGKVEIVHPIQEVAKARQVPAEVSEAVHEFISGMEDIEKRLAPYRKDYEWFFPSLLLGNLLFEIYPNDLNPGLKIADFIRTSFGSADSPKPSEFFYNEEIRMQYRLPLQSELHQLLVAVGEEAVRRFTSDSILQEGILACIREVLDPFHPPERGIEFADHMAAALHAPSELYYRWLTERFISVEPYLEGERTIDQEEFIDLLHFLPIGRGSLPLITDPAVWREGEESFFEKCGDKLPLLSTTRFLSHSTFLHVVAGYQLSEEGLDDTGREVLELTLERLEQYSRCYLAGSSPFDGWRCGFSCYLLAGEFPVEKLPLHVLFAAADDELGAISFGGFVEEEFIAGMDYWNKKQTNYLVTFKKCLDDGRPELGVALLSLFILGRAALTQVKFGNLADLTAAIDVALKLPGARMLRHTLKVVVETVTDHFPKEPLPVAAMNYFKRYVSEPEIAVLEGGRRQKDGKKDVREWLVQELGENRWQKLSQESQKLLISAVALWKASATEFGFGIHDWSGIIIPYCKAIENELVQRLATFYHSAEYRAYLEVNGKRWTDKPLAGVLLHSLKAYPVLPQRLKDLLAQSSIRVYESQKFCSQLKDLFDRYRNMFAHKDIAGMVTYSEFYNKLFGEKMLHTFIDHLQ